MKQQNEVAFWKALGKHKNIVVRYALAVWDITRKVNFNYSFVYIFIHMGFQCNGTLESETSPHVFFTRKLVQETRAWEGKCQGEKPCLPHLCSIYNLIYLGDLFTSLDLIS